ncbi:hypothetical protein [Fulvivirga imtechensis]|nr:hypothetical protein [Fulvivirga imtechensis]
MSTGTNKTFDLRFAKINILGFSQFDQKNSFNKNAYPLIDFLTNIQFRVIEDVKRISCLITVKMKIKETDEAFAELKVETQFEVNPFDQTIVKESKDTNDYQIPNILMYNVANVSVSTVRGILYEKLKGTVAQDEVFPLIDLAPQFMKNQPAVK